MRNEEELTVPPWLEAQQAALATMLDRRQSPQALLIYGAAGTGRRRLAFWFAARLLGIPGGRFAPLTELEPGEDAEISLAHPDVLLVRTPPDKDNIPVEAVRGLIEFLHLRSHQGGARVAVVWPADALTRSAANSLLKTLEEPPAGSAIVLVASSAASLPATVISRCQRLRINTPPRGIARAWLERMDGDANWDLLLDFAGGAPLRAHALYRTGFGARAERYAEDLRQLGAGGGPIAPIARRWAGAGADAEVLLAWLYGRVAGEITASALATTGVSGSEARQGRLQKPWKALNMRAGLERLRLIQDLYRNRSRSMNPELQFMALLQGWRSDAGD